MFLVVCKYWRICVLVRLAPVLITMFHQCVISYTCSKSNSDGSVLKHCFKNWRQSMV